MQFHLSRAQWMRPPRFNNKNERKLQLVSVKWVVDEAWRAQPQPSKCLMPPHGKALQMIAIWMDAQICGWNEDDCL
jgi:hypothetical protein